MTRRTARLKAWAPSSRRDAVAEGRTGLPPAGLAYLSAVFLAQPTRCPDRRAGFSARLSIRLPLAFPVALLFGAFACVDGHAVPFARHPSRFPSLHWVAADDCAAFSSNCGMRFDEARRRGERSCIMAEERAHGSSTEIDYHRVKADPTARISPSCSLVGDVTLGKKVAVMAGSCLRGDDAPIVVEDECNIQEGVVIHEDYGKPVAIGRHTTVGHRAMLHGCVIGENCLIGMSCTIMNGRENRQEQRRCGGGACCRRQRIPRWRVDRGRPGEGSPRADRRR